MEAVKDALPGWVPGQPPKLSRFLFQRALPYLLASVELGSVSDAPRPQWSACFGKTLLGDSQIWRVPHLFARASRLARACAVLAYGERFDVTDITLLLQQDPETVRRALLEAEGAVETQVLAARTSSDVQNVLIHAYQSEIYRYASRIVGVERAKDATQETFMTMMAILPSYQPDRSLRAWLLKIAYFKCMKTFRFQAIDRVVAEPQLDKIPGEPVKQAIDQQIHVNRVIELISREFSGQPLKHRQIFILFYYNRLSIPEIAEITGDPTGTIKSQLHRMRNALRQVLEQLKIDNR